jgi:hypothetical protein
VASRSPAPPRAVSRAAGVFDQACRRDGLAALAARQTGIVAMQNPRGEGGRPTI